MRACMQVRKQKKELREAGVELFNTKPKKGIAFLYDNGVLPRDDHAAVAQFLLQNDRLDKSAVRMPLIICCSYVCVGLMSLWSVCMCCSSYF